MSIAACRLQNLIRNVKGFISLICTILCFAVYVQMPLSNCITAKIPSGGSSKRCTKLATSLEAATKAAEAAGKKSARLEELLGKNEDRRIGADAERQKAVDALAGAKREVDEGRRKLTEQE
eukprot:scaffold839_cov16-Prasinocladus_malaysianus.AAC.1